MKRAWLLGIPILLIALLVAFRPVEGQDNLQDRVAALETQVAELQAIIGVGATSIATPLAAVSNSSELVPNSPSVHTITGTLRLIGQPVRATLNGLTGEIFPGENGECYGYGGLDDIVEGAAVVVRDGNGSILATSRLGVGKPDPDYPDVTCVFPFTVKSVPEAPFYEIEVSNRGGLAISFDEMKESNWSVALDLSS